MNAPLRLSAMQRGKLRKAIVRAPNWKHVRQEHGFSIETMSADALLTAASLLNLDILQITGEQPEQPQENPDMNAHHKPRPHEPEAVLALAQRLEAIRDKTNTTDAGFIADVLKTISERQEGRASDSQYWTLYRIAEKYEAIAPQIVKRDTLATSYKTGSLAADITPEQITAKLGFAPTGYDDPDKVTMNWSFEIDGRGASIWDYKGERWSVYDPYGKLPALFAEKPAAKPTPKPRERTPEPMPAAPIPAPMSGDQGTHVGAQLAALIAQLAGKSIDIEHVRVIVAEEIEAAFERVPSIRIEIAAPNGEVREVGGHQHPQFKTLLRAASSRMANGYPPSIWLAGPAGSGKTHAGHQLADALALPFHLNGALSMPHELLGFIDAGGTYHRTPFREAYEHGGVYMFDEVDGSDNSALLALNAALANGHATFPDAKIKRHENCIILASANTWGLGATAEYVGRAKIDAAFLSRFPVRIAWDYDTALEVAISGNEKFARRVIAARERARAAGLKVLIDPRASQAGAALIAAGMSEDEAAAVTYLANVTPEQRKQVEGR